MPMLLVCDLDGTLTFTGRRPEPVVLEALRRAVAAPGVRLAVATARSARCVRAWFPDLVDSIDMVCCNGSLHCDRRGRIHQQPLPVRALRTLVARLDRADIGWCAEYGDHFVASAPHVLPRMGVEHRRVRARPRSIDAGVLKLCVEDAAGLALATRLSGVTTVAHSSGDGDVLAAGVGKHAVVERIRHTAKVVAFGNDRNDLELLCRADRGFVVGSTLAVPPWVRGIAAEPEAVAAGLHEVLDSTATGAEEGVLQRSSVPA